MGFVLGLPVCCSSVCLLLARFISASRIRFVSITMLSNLLTTLTAARSRYLIISCYQNKVTRHNSNLSSTLCLRSQTTSRHKRSELNPNRHFSSHTFSSTHPQPHRPKHDLFLFLPVNHSFPSWENMAVLLSRRLNSLGRTLGTL